MVRIQLPGFDIKKIAESGQCFRMKETAGSVYTMIAKDKRLTVEAGPKQLYTFHCTVKDFEERWRPYFDLDTDYDFFLRSVPAEDRFLSDAIRYGSGLTILRQDPWEMMISFIISQNKNIPAIRKCVENLCLAFGSKIEPNIYAFPTAEQIADGKEEDLCSCSLGYRVRYIKSAARMAADGVLDLKRLAEMPDDELLSALLSIHGVGAKVANCIMLFGFHRLGAFPKDVWINRIIENEYQGSFPEERYPGYAGVIQQYIFYYARSPEYQMRMASMLQSAQN